MHGVFDCKLLLVIKNELSTAPKVFYTFKQKRGPENTQEIVVQERETETYQGISFLFYFSGCFPKNCLQMGHSFLAEPIMKHFFYIVV